MLVSELAMTATGFAELAKTLITRKSPNDISDSFLPNPNMRFVVLGCSTLIRLIFKSKLIFVKSAGRVNNP